MEEAGRAPVLREGSAGFGPRMPIVRAAGSDRTEWVRAPARGRDAMGGVLGANLANDGMETQEMVRTGV